MVVVFGSSAWAWWRTPPQIIEAAIFEDAARARYDDGAAMEASYLRGLRSFERRDEQESRRLVRSRLLTDLIGVPLPVEVLVDADRCMVKTKLVTPHRCTRVPPNQHLHDLGNGLFVASHYLALVQMASRLSFIQLMLLLFEACGTYALFKPTQRVVQQAAIRLGLAGLEHEVSGVARDSARGPDNVVPWSFDQGCSHEYHRWSPAVDRHGCITDLWNRPPLMTSEDLAVACSEFEGMRGVKALRHAIQFVIEGSASPLETKLLLIECLPPRYGGESWPVPLVNARIDFTEEARCLSGTRYAIGDQVWAERKVVVEVNGEAFHADRQGFKVGHGRTAALEAMGYEVVEINYDQMSDPLKLEARLAVLAKKIRLPLQKRTVRFLERREALLAELFGSDQAACKRDAGW